MGGHLCTYSWRNTAVRQRRTSGRRLRACRSMSSRVPHLSRRPWYRRHHPVRQPVTTHPRGAARPSPPRLRSNRRAPGLPVDAASGCRWFLPGRRRTHHPPSLPFPAPPLPACSAKSRRIPPTTPTPRPPAAQHDNQGVATFFPIPLCAYQAPFIANPPLPLTIQGARAIGLDACEAVAMSTMPPSVMPAPTPAVIQPC